MSPVPSASRAAGRGSPGFVELPLLDKLIDAEPERVRDQPITAAETLAQLLRAVHRDVEALLNARRPWRSLPADLADLRLSPLGYGIADFTAGAFNERRQREALRSEIEGTIRCFEPRLAAVQAALVDDGDALRTTLRLRIEALLRVQPAPEPIAFDTAVDFTTTAVTVHSSRAL